MAVLYGRLKWNVVFQRMAKHDSEGGVLASVTHSAHRKELDPKQRSSTSGEFQDALRNKIVRQGEAVQALVELYEVFRAGLRFFALAVGNLLFMGPTGRSEFRYLEDRYEFK